jgi:DNA-binding transcriptional MerR regulator
MSTGPDPQRYSIGELVQATGVSRRTVRFYVQTGLLPPPKGKGRGHYYETEHFERLTRIRELRDRGYSLDRVRSALDGRGDEIAVPTIELVARVRVADGVELVVGQGATPPTPSQVVALAHAAARILSGHDDND